MNRCKYYHPILTPEEAAQNKISGTTRRRFRTRTRKFEKEILCVICGLSIKEHPIKKINDPFPGVNYWGQIGLNAGLNSSHVFLSPDKQCELSNILNAKKIYEIERDYANSKRTEAIMTPEEKELSRKRADPFGWLGK